MSPTELKQKLEGEMKGAEVYVQDLTGTSDHYQVTIISSSFEGKSMVDQHRLVKGILERDIASGEVHALSLKTYTPQEWVTRRKADGRP